MPATYSVPVEQRVSGRLLVEANSVDKARELAESGNGDFFPGDDYGYYEVTGRPVKEVE